jgi:aldehyde:ferredoxin oxidoreductase
MATPGFAGKILQAGPTDASRHEACGGRYVAERRKRGEHFAALRPSLVAVGPAVENKARIGSLVHGAGSGAGRGGHGGAFASKDLRAISVVDGTELGRKPWNLERANLVPEGRIREMEIFSGFMHKSGASHVNVMGGVPICDGSKWG